MPSVFGQREDLYRVNVKVTGPDGKTWKATFDSMDGGEVSATDLKYRPGNGTNDEQSLGGQKTVGNITVAMLLTFDAYQMIPWLFSVTGTADFVVTKQPLATDGSASTAKALVYSGTLLSVTPPKTQSNGNETAALLSLVGSIVTPVTTG